jgi:hypothetical protein
VEAAMLNCSQTTNELKQNENTNFCALVAVIVPLLTEGAISPGAALTLCSVLRSGLENGDGSSEWGDAVAQLTSLVEAGVGKNTNQVESYQKQIIDLIAGPGTAPGVD